MLWKDFYDHMLNSQHKKAIRQKKLAIHPMITRSKLSLMSEDEVDNYMVQLPMTKGSQKFITLNVNDFHKRITYSIPKEYQEKQKMEGPNELNGWWEYIKTQTFWFRPYLSLLR